MYSLYLYVALQVFSSSSLLLCGAFKKHGEDLRVEESSKCKMILQDLYTIQSVVSWYFC